MRSTAKRSRERRCNGVSPYREELIGARRQGAEAYAAMEAWVSAPADAPEIPGAILERHAKNLRESRERIQKLIAENGERDDLTNALSENEEFHKTVGLSIRDKPEPEPPAE
jgi:hypothetical protein